MTIESIKKSLFKICITLKDSYLYLFRHALIVNAYVCEKPFGGIAHQNWGDDLNYYLIKRITGRPVVFYENFMLAKWFNLKNYMCIGTVLDAYYYCNRGTIVWGSGTVGVKWVFEKPYKICSVRGQLTRKFLVDNQIDCPNNFGDPALLLPVVYSPNIEKKYKLGLIPHVSDLDNSLVREFCEEKDVLLIDLKHYDRWTDVIDQVLSCEQIASSSLHGLIVSDAYGIPNCWVSFGGKIGGGDFKFLDYFSSVQRKDQHSLAVKKKEDFQEVFKQMTKWKAPVIDVQEILRVCPFDVKL